MFLDIWKNVMAFFIVKKDEAVLEDITEFCKERG